MARSTLAAALLAALAGPAAAQADDRLLHLGEDAHGTVSVTKTAGVYTLRFTGDEVVEYQIDLNDPAVQRGRIRVRETHSDAWPLSNAGVGYRDVAGNARGPDWLQVNGYSALVADASTADSVVLDYVDTIPAPDSAVLRRRHTFTLRGKSLRVRVQDRDGRRLWRRNYCGLLVGGTAGTEAPKYVFMQGALITPITMYRDGAERWYMGYLLDLFQSNAAAWSLHVQGHLSDASTSFRNTLETFDLYRRAGDDRISGALDDEIAVTISTRLRDVLLTPSTPPSPYRELLEGRTVLILPGSGTAPPYATTWDAYRGLWDLFDQWGMFDLAGYYFANWVDPSRTDPALVPGAGFIQNAGPDWWPARDPAAFATMVQDGRARGYLLGAYMAFNELPPTSPLYAASLNDRAFDDLGAAKTGLHTGFDSLAASACLSHAVREATLVEQDYGLNAAYLDIQTYASPSGGADGDHVDQRAGTRWARSLRRAFRDQKTWMRRMNDIYEGPMLGEGSIATSSSSMEWLWAGYCDSVQRVINTNSGHQANAIPAGDPVAPTSWPVIPEFELRVMKRLQANHGNGFPDRFFGPSDGPGMVDMSTGETLFPMTEAALDRYRVYEITYGKTSFVATNGPWNGVNGAATSNYTYFADVIKEYYLGNALQAHYLDAPVRSIHYFDGGTFKTFEQIFGASGTTDSFRDPRIRTVYTNGLEVWVNHATTPWAVSVGGTAYTIPEDGFVAWRAGEGGNPDFRCFSAVAPGTGGSRVDYCYAPGRWEFFDGRGAVGAYAGIDTGGVRRLRLRNFVTDATVYETATGAINVIPGTPPALVRVDVLPPVVTLAPGESVGLHAVATYANGAFRDVTTLVGWSSSSAAVARVNRGAALKAVAPGTATIACGAFQGVACTPAALTVP